MAIVTESTHESSSICTSHAFLMTHFSVLRILDLSFIVFLFHSKLAMDAMLTNCCFNKRVICFCSFTNHVGMVELRPKLGSGEGAPTGEGVRKVGEERETIFYFVF